MNKEILLYCKELAKKELVTVVGKYVDSVFVVSIDDIIEAAKKLKEIIEFIGEYSNENK